VGRTPECSVVIVDKSEKTTGKASIFKFDFISERQAVGLDFTTE
jgi:hypothetical protein